MKIENLHIGQRIKNHKELCSVLDIPCEKGNRKNATLEKLKFKVKYYQMGHSFSIY